MSLKIQNPVLKYRFSSKLSKYKKNENKKKKNIFVHTTKCLTAKKSWCFFYIYKKCFSMHFSFNNQFIKVKRTLVKISKTTKILFCLSFSIQSMNLHVKGIPYIKTIVLL
jgi:hypothetical protein